MHPKKSGRIPIVFIEMLLKNGCKFLNLNRATLIRYSDKTWEFPTNCQLKYFNMSISDYFMNGKILEQLLSCCHNLEKLSLGSECNDCIVESICQNGQTLHVLDLNFCRGI